MLDISEQYKDASNLDARAALHSRFSLNRVNWHRWVFEHFTLPEGARVLELGCGPARLWRENLDRLPKNWDITLTDFSAGMIFEAAANLPNSFTFAVADAQDLPFADAVFDAVIANHMLYHVPDLPKALSEVRRILRPRGRLFTATNGENHMRELDDLSQDLVEGGVVKLFSKTAHVTDFTLETAPDYFRPYFSGVTLHRPDGDPDLLVTEAEPIIAYILSVTPDEITKDTVKISALRERVNGVLAETGDVRITRASGLFEARV